MPGRRIMACSITTVQYLQLTCAIELNRLQTGIGHEYRLTACVIANPELMLSLGHFADAYGEDTHLGPNCTFDNQTVSQVAMSTLVERTGESNSRLN